MDSLKQRMDRLSVREEDLEERFILGSGSGGQKINKTSSCVYLKHLPSGHEVQCQESRSREKNRTLARERICDFLEKRIAEDKLEQARNLARQRYRTRKPSRAAKARTRLQKRIRSDRKGLRKRISD
jgi:peptide chain release factor